MALYFNVLATPPSMWDIRSLTKDGTLVHALEVWSLNHWVTREVPGDGTLRTRALVHSSSTHNFLPCNWLSPSLSAWLSSFLKKLSFWAGVVGCGECVWETGKQSSTLQWPACSVPLGTFPWDSVSSSYWRWSSVTGPGLCGANRIMCVCVLAFGTWRWTAHGRSHCCFSANRKFPPKGRKSLATKALPQGRILTNGSGRKYAAAGREGGSHCCPPPLSLLMEPGALLLLHAPQPGVEALLQITVA